MLPVGGLRGFAACCLLECVGLFVLRGLVNSVVMVFCVFSDCGLGFDAFVCIRCCICGGFGVCLPGLLRGGYVCAGFWCM